MASGHVTRTNRPNTWLQRPSLRREDSPCQLRPRRHSASRCLTSYSRSLTSDRVIGLTLLHPLTSAHGTKGRSPPCTKIGRYRSEADKPGRELAVKSAALSPLRSFAGSKFRSAASPAAGVETGLN
jgi:hypothetical protein